MITICTHMINKMLVFIFIAVFSATIIAQDNRTENGMKIGKWVNKDAKDFVYSEGNYSDNFKIGKWKYYISPISRYTHVPDVEGSYDNLGKKTGTWVFISTQTKIRVEAEFVNDLMEGRCTYYAANGDIMAQGFMNAGIRHGKWAFYHKDHKITEGHYQNGIRIGDWVYDYYPEKDLHIKGKFNFDDRKKNGKLEYYRVDHHPKFGTEELLSGIGQYVNNNKVGRWIEYSQGIKGAFVETGNYNRAGKRHGYWKSTIDRKNYQAAMYNNGVLNGVFKQFHDNGKLKYQTNYEDGLPTGAFIRYYDNGNIEEKGTTVFSPNPSDVTRDTAYYFLDLPYEYHFQLVELPGFEKLDHHYVDWIEDPGYSIEPAELDRHFAIYKDYGLEPHKRVIDIRVTGRKAVRKGAYQSFFKNGKLKLEGQYYPQVKEIFDPETNTRVMDYARDGEWKQYDENGYIMRTITYDKGELIKMLDDKGNEMGVGAGSSSSDDASTEAPVEEETRRVEIIRNN